jgi:hypothetical protein
MTFVKKVFCIIEQTCSRTIANLLGSRHDESSQEHRRFDNNKVGLDLNLSLAQQNYRLIRQPDTDTGSGVTLSLPNVRSVADKIDEVRIELRRDHLIDVSCLVETWHDADWLPLIH